EFDARLRRLLLELVARSLEIGDVGFVELRDVRDIDPARMQTRTRNLLNARQRLGFYGTELREVDGRNDWQTASATCRRTRRGRSRRRQRVLHKPFDVVVRDTTLEAASLHPCQIDAELSSEFTNGRPRMGLREP